MGGIRHKRLLLHSDDFLFCTEEYLLPKEVHVLDGTIVSITGESYNSEVHYDFRKINDFIEEKAKSNPSSFGVSYDEQYGFPTRIALDPMEQITDDEITYKLSDFKY